MTQNSGNLPASDPKESDKIDPLKFGRNVLAIFEKPKVCYVRESVLELSRKFGFLAKEYFKEQHSKLGHRRRS